MIQQIRQEKHQLKIFASTEDSEKTSQPHFVYASGEFIGVNRIKFIFLFKKNFLKVMRPWKGIKRDHNLWMSTCFEAFWQLEGCEKYGELNFNESGQWNVYSFENYRKGLKESFDLIMKQIHFSSSGDDICLTAYLEHSFTHKEKENLRFSLCIVQDLGQNKFYWSNYHPLGDRPDFHQSSSRFLVFSSSD